MEITQPPRTSTLARIVTALLLAAGGLAIFVLGLPYYKVFSTNKNPYYIATLTIFFLLLTIGLSRAESLKRYWPACYALFSASFATWFLIVGGLDLAQYASSPAQELAYDKLSQFVKVVVPLILLTLLVRHDWATIFLKVGNLKTGLVVGGISFAFFAILGALAGLGFGVSPQLMLSSLPWILVFVFANSIMEELWFRGVFLKRYVPLIGRWPAFLVTALPFGVSHVMSTYMPPAQVVIYGFVVFLLGIAGAYLMYKTNSLIGPVLLHAGYDLLIIVPVLATM